MIRLIRTGSSVLVTLDSIDNTKGIRVYCKTNLSGDYSYNINTGKVSRGSKKVKVTSYALQEAMEAMAKLEDALENKESMVDLVLSLHEKIEDIQDAQYDE